MGILGLTAQRSADMNNGNNRDWFMVLTLGLEVCLSGCLPEDPGLRTGGRAPEEPPVASQKQVQTAPTQIDSTILITRAFGEAPILARRVALGELPPVSERLPENPLVVVPFEEIGTYGGDLRRALTGDIVQTAGVSKTLNENLMGFERPYPNSIQLNMAEKYWFEDEGRTAIFKIRKGIKWSDGARFTVDDILFWYYDMTLNDDARDAPMPPSVWLVGDRPIQMEKVDDHTLRIFSDKPMGRVLNALCADNVAYPKHILARHHPRYNPEATYEAFRDSTTAAQMIMSPGMPRLSAWCPVEWIRGQRIVYERNPYYWKVDTAGNQLPYADRLVFTLIRDSQVILLKFINGEIDLYGRYSRISMYTTLRVEEQKGKFNLHLAESGSGPAFYLNWDCPNPVLREAFRNKQVRMALSHAVNREEISEIVYFGLLEPAGYSFSRSNPYYSEAAHKMYSAYDPDKARQLLDAAGYKDADGDGYRELLDGSRFELNIDVVAPGGGVDACELIRSHWEAVGVKVNLNGSLRDIIWPRRVNGDFDIHYWGLEGPQDPLGRLNDWAIMGPTVPFWHRNASEEAPDWLKEATRYIQQTLTTVDTTLTRTYMEGARDLHTNNLAVIAVGSAPAIWGSSTRLGNVPRKILIADVYRGFGREIGHEQIFIRP
jgi:peptide/nickel transport system substrate-binding protein